MTAETRDAAPTPETGGGPVDERPAVEGATAAGAPAAGPATGTPSPQDGDAAAGEPPYPPVGRPGLAALLAWTFPGLGHLYLRRWGRGLAFCVLVLVPVVVGTALEGRLWTFGEGALSVLFTVVSAALGLPYLVLLAGGYAGDVAARGYEYGTAFLLTAALMNVLLVLDARDVSLGRKP